jgi:predicted short-subunit dehydrogenase-like oxidoreductase (DUF2520 family)
MKVSIIGTGNVAYVLGKLCVAAGHRVIQVFGRNNREANTLAGMLHAQAVSDWKALGHPESMLYIVCLPDKVLPELAQWWQTSKGLVVHTAGSVSRDVLADVANNYGVLYPLQSLRKERMPVTPFPLLTDANTPDDLSLLTDFAESLTGMTGHCNDEQRLHLHLAAVLANNFTNHLYQLAMDYCSNHQIDAAWLKPLIRETAERIEDHDPGAMQTGPAIRHDQPTIDKHMAMLQNDPHMAELYRWFTRSIQQKHPRD